MLWAYLILVGQQTSLSESTVGNVVAIAAGGGLIGGILAASIGGKITRSKLCNIGLFIEILLVMALTHFFYNWLFIIFAPALIASIYFLLPLYMGMAAESDPSGRLPTMAGGIFLLSGGTGPLLGGYLVESLGVQAIGWAIMAGSLFAMSCIYWLERRKSSG